MIIKCNAAKTIKVCGVNVHPGEFKYRKLSMKDAKQRLVLLTLRDSGILGFYSKDTLKNEDGSLKEVSLKKLEKVEKAVDADADATEKEEADVAKPEKGTDKPGGDKSRSSGKGKLPKKGN